MARDRAFDLQKMEFLGIELLLSLGQLAFEDGQLTIAILKDGIGTAEHRELHLLILCPRIDLRGELPELHLEFR